MCIILFAESFACGSVFFVSFTKGSVNNPDFMFCNKAFFFSFFGR